MAPVELVPPAPPAPVRYSRLKLMALSPAHYQAATLDQTYAVERGSAVHSIVLETEEVLPWEKISDKGNQCPRSGKDFDKFQADHPGAIILMPGEYRAAKAQADAIRANPLAMRVLSGRRENEIAFKLGGRDCGGRPDSYDRKLVAELKCTVSSKPSKFARQARNLGYKGQVVWYGDGLRAAGLADPEDYYIVASESAAPYVVTVFKLTPDAVEQARRTYRGWFEQLMVCEQSNEWPGYAQGVVPLEADETFDLDFTGMDEAAA